MNTTYMPAHGYAGFWKRGAAFFIDLVIIMFPQAYLGDAFGSAFVSRMSTVDPVQEYIGYSLWAQLIAVAVAWVYTAGMESSLFQATFGKLILGIHVASITGERLSFSQASGRFLGRIGSALLAGLGFISIAFSEKKQGLHDIMANTLVVNNVPINTDTQYARIREMLRSPVIAALVVACGAVIAASMFKQPIASDRSGASSSLGLGTIRVIHSTEKPIVMQQVLTGPNIIDNGREYIGPIRIGQVPIEIKSDKPIGVALSSQKVFGNSAVDSPIAISLGGKIQTEIPGFIQHSIYNGSSGAFQIYGLGF